MSRRSDTAGSRRRSEISANSSASISSISARSAGTGPASRMRRVSIRSCMPVDVASSSCGTSQRRRSSRCASETPKTAVQDHLERHALHVGMQRERSTERAALELALGDLGHEVLIRTHSLAMERRQHQPPPLQGALRPPEAGSSDPRPGDAARTYDPAAVTLTLGIQGADRARIADHYQRRAHPDETHAKRVTEAPPAGLQKRDRPHQPPRSLDQRQLARPPRERRHSQRIGHRPSRTVVHTRRPRSSPAPSTSARWRDERCHSHLHLPGLRRSDDSHSAGVRWRNRRAASPADTRPLLAQTLRKLGAIENSLLVRTSWGSACAGSDEMTAPSGQATAR